MCARTVETSGFCKVEMSKPPFRGAISEAEIGSRQSRLLDRHGL